MTEPSKALQTSPQAIRESVEFALQHGTHGPLIIGALIDAIVASPRLRQLTAAIWQDLGEAGASQPADPAQNPMPYMVPTPEATEGLPYPVGVDWDPSEGPFATIEERRAGVPNQITLSDVEEGAALPVTAVWDGAETVDLSSGQTLNVSLDANSTVTLFDNMRGGVGFVFRVTNGGAFTLAFAAAGGVEIEELNDLTVESGDGSVTTYVGVCLTIALIQIAKAGSVAA
jgi:hypothetical protein